MGPVIGQSEEEGARALIYAATSPDMEGVRLHGLRWKCRGNLASCMHVSGHRWACVLNVKRPCASKSAAPVSDGTVVVPSCPLTSCRQGW